MIIALTGYKGSGKNFAGDIITQSYAFKQIAFVDPVKSVIKTTFKLDSDEQYDVFKRTEHSLMGSVIYGRDIVLNVGMAMRQVNSDFTIDYANRFKDQSIVITDLRFDNELDWCINNNAVVIKIINSQNNDVDHISERGFNDDQCDYVMFNDMTQQFENDIHEIIKEVIKNDNSGSKH